MLSRRTFILGGACSGKSHFAEQIVESAYKSKVYIATAQAFDAEMRTKIARHQNDRKSADRAWRLIEAPMNADEALAKISGNEIVLIDCATMWLTNQMLAETDLEAARDALLCAINACPGQVVTVSNEVGLSIVPENTLARRFRDEQGRLNRALAAQADLAVLVAAGLPLVLKGQLPDSFA